MSIQRALPAQASKIILIAMITLFGCGTRPDPAPSVAPSPDSPPRPPNVVASPFERVTDTAVAALTQQDIKAVTDACNAAANLPNSEIDCPDIARRLDACLATKRCWLKYGSFASNADAGFIQIQDDRPNSPACRDGNPLCAGIEVPASTVERIRRNHTGDRTTASPAATPTPSSTSPAPTPSATRTPGVPRLPQPSVAPLPDGEVAPKSTK